MLLRRDLLLPLAALTVGSCASSAKPSAPTCATANITPSPLAQSWWEQGDAACPAGATLTEQKNHAQTFSCTLPSGKMHGPFRAESKGAVLTEGWYVHGAKHGAWRRYDGIMHRYVRERFDCDTLLERLPEAEPSAEASEATDGH